MGIITRMRKQTAVLWERDGIDRWGKPKYRAPVQIKCRWQDVNQEFIDDKGDRQVSASLVFPDRVVAVNSVLMLGELGDVVDSENPKQNDGAWEVRRFDEIPNLRNTETLYKAFL